MDRRWLAAQLAAERSLESIAREVGRDPSTVAYWAARFGLRSSHAERHAAKGPLARRLLEALVAGGLSTREIAVRMDRSPTVVRYWLKRYSLTTARRFGRAGPDAPSEVIRHCRTHGWTAFGLRGSGHYGCQACNMARVSARRRRLKEQVVRDAGGRCAGCGYDRNLAGLHFHHVDPREKRFAVAAHGARSLDALRHEVKKCVLLCANCHAEVESGVRAITPPA